MKKFGPADASLAIAPRRQTTAPDPRALAERHPSAGQADADVVRRKDGEGHDRDGSPEPVFSLTPLDGPRGLARSWNVLEERCNPSLFQSWGWIDAWLGILPPEIEPLVLTARRADAVCGLGILCRAQRRRHGWLASNGLFLHETGVPDLDALTVEYNGMLCDDTEKTALTAAAMRFLVDAVDGWDELYLSGVDEGILAAAGACGLHVTVTARHPCHFVDLADIREREKSYLDCLSRNTRSQVRRAVRRYEERGELTVNPAGSVDQALSYFDDMKVLHQAYWQSRGQPGAFANPVFEAFHRAFITARFSCGEIEMLRIAVDDEAIGYLYNIVHRKHVYSYQSGFAYEQDGAMKPGLVSHYLAIERNLSQDAAVYDFMAGGGQHKRSLGTACRDMVWLRAARPRLKFRIEALLRTARQRLAPSRPD